MRTRDGKNLVYHTYGPEEGPVIVLVHGLGADHQMWRPQIETYPRRGYRLIVPDVRGHGDSDSVESLTLDDWVEDLREILDAEGVSRATMMGVSMGGVITQSFAVAHQDRLDRLVLSDTFHELRRPIHKFIGAAAVFSFRLYKLFGKKRLAAATGSAYDNPTVREYFTYSMEKNDLDQLILARQAINAVDLAEELSSVETPTLVLVGTDFGEHFVKISRELASCLPNARLVELSGAKDPSNLVNPDAFDEQVFGFLEHTDSASHAV